MHSMGFFKFLVFKSEIYYKHLSISVENFTMHVFPYPMGVSH